MPAPRRVYKYDPTIGKVVRVDDNIHAGNHLPMINRAYAKRPVESVAMGVGAEQAGELRKTLSGIPGCEVKRNGNPVFTGAKARDRAMRRLGFFDRG